MGLDSFLYIAESQDMEEWIAEIWKKMMCGDEILSLSMGPFFWLDKSSQYEFHDSRIQINQMLPLFLLSIDSMCQAAPHSIVAQNNKTLLPSLSPHHSCLSNISTAFLAMWVHVRRDLIVPTSLSSMPCND